MTFHVLKKLSLETLSLELVHQTKRKMLDFVILNAKLDITELGLFVGVMHLKDGLDVVWELLPIVLHVESKYLIK